jgi:hypothetical protein
VIVHTGRRVAVDDENAAGHAEMHDRGTIRSVQEQVLGTPVDGHNGGASQVLVDIGADRPAKPAITYDDVVDAFTDEVRRYAAAACFDFR